MSGCPIGHDLGSAECSDHHWNSWLVKRATMKVSDSVVSILTYGLPDDKLDYCGDIGVLNSPCPENEPVCWGCGVIIECDDQGDGMYFATILTAATLFKRTTDNNSCEIKVNVYLSGGVRMIGEIICIDFHYNLAAVRVQGNSQLTIVKLRELNDRLSLDPSDPFNQQYHQQYHQQQPSFQMRPHSTLMKIVPGELVIALGRFFLNGHYKLEVTPGFFREKRYGHDCAELYALKCCGEICTDGGPVINRSGEMIGIRFHNTHHEFTPFLPTNVISRWWSHQKEFGEFRRPWLGMKIWNLHAAGYDILRTMPNIAAGVIVTEVKHGSPANLARIHCHDVIVQCNGIGVRSILEFFEAIWENSGRSVDLKVMRVIDSNVVERKRTLRIGDTTPDNFYNWCLPAWHLKKPAWAMLEEQEAGNFIYDD